MVGHQDLAINFASGFTKGTGSRMFIEGDVIYSYGRHFPIALRLKDNIFLVNIDKYSSSTSRHQSYVISAISSAHEGSIIECNTQDINGAIDKNPFCIEKKFEYNSIDECFNNIKNITVF